MKAYDDLVRTIQNLQLPLGGIPIELAAQKIYKNNAPELVRPEDFAADLNADINNWTETRVASKTLRKIFRELLDNSPYITGDGYLKVYKILRNGSVRDWKGLNHAMARRLLSRTPLIKYLLSEERFSATQVSRLLQTLESQLDVPYNAVQVLAREIDKLPQLQPDSVSTLFTQDENRALTLFPDSTDVESCHIAASEISTWIPSYDASADLITLIQSVGNSEPNWPYLQILHWCTTPLEYYDHPASYLYEFSPRGAVASSIFERYPTSTANPVLNNAKAVSRFDANWARNRAGEDGHALVRILEMLETAAFSDRRLVARTLRSWLMRITELRTVEPTPLPETLSIQDFRKVSSFIAKGESNTQGTIEQRIVDALSSLVYSDDRWISKGLGDGVNASNTSKRKLGDIEFIDADGRRSVAIEAHGGFLSRTYVEGHQKSLSNLIEQRLTESWLDIAPPDDWTVQVIFIAHSRAPDGLPSTDSIHGVNIEYEYKDYQGLLDEAFSGSRAEDQLKAFAAHVVEPMNRKNVRQSARNRILEILGR